MKHLLVKFLRAFGLYGAIVVGGTYVFIVIIQVIGYLPYSDRPGPGWYGPFPVRTLAGLAEVLLSVAGWAVLVLVSSLFVVVPLFIIVQLLEWALIPRAVNVAVGGLLGGLVSFYFFVGMGWYIALAEPSMIVAGLLGAFYGGRILPSREHTNVLDGRLHLGRIFIAISLSIGIFYLLFPDIFRSLIYGRSGSYTVKAMITKGTVAVSGIRLRLFDHPDACTGQFSEAITNPDGLVAFQRAYKSDEFPQRGSCEYRVTLCYQAENEWRRLWSGGHGGSCGGHSQDTVQLDLSRPGEYKMESRF